MQRSRLTSRLLSRRLTAQAHDIFAPSPVSPKSRHARSSATEAYHTDNFLKRPESMTASEHLATQVGRSRARGVQMAMENIEDFQSIGCRQSVESEKHCRPVPQLLQFCDSNRNCVWL